MNLPKSQSAPCSYSLLAGWLWHWPPVQGLQPEGQSALATLGFCVCWWLFGAVPLPVTSLVGLGLLSALGALLRNSVGAVWKPGRILCGRSFHCGSGLCKPVPCSFDIDRIKNLVAVKIHCAWQPDFVGFVPWWFRTLLQPYCYPLSLAWFRHWTWTIGQSSPGDYCWVFGVQQAPTLDCYQALARHCLWILRRSSCWIRWWVIGMVEYSLAHPHPFLSLIISPHFALAFPPEACLYRQPLPLDTEIKEKASERMDTMGTN